MADEPAPKTASESATAASPPRLASMSRSGRHVIIRTLEGVELVDALGTAPRIPVAAPDLVDFAAVGGSMWLIDGDTLRRVSFDNGKDLGPAARVPTASVGRPRLFPAPTRDARSAVWQADRRHLLHVVDDELRAYDVHDETDGAELVAAVGGRRLLVARDRAVRIRDANRGEVARVNLPLAGTPRTGAGLFGNRAFVVLTSAQTADSFVVFRPEGALVHQISLPRTDAWAIAENRGMALVHTHESKLVAVDLRYGRPMAEANAPIPVSELDLDSDGKYLTLAGFDETDQLAVLHFPYTDLFGGGGNLAARPARRPPRPEPSEETRERDGDGAAETEDDPESSIDRSRLQRPEPEAPRVDAASGDPELPPEDEEDPRPEPRSAAEPVSIPDLRLRALGRPIELPPAGSTSTLGVKHYETADEHLEDLLDVVAARTARAIADAWDSGRLSMPTDDPHPFATEVNALVGSRSTKAPEAVAEASLRLRRAVDRATRRANASLARGVKLPLFQLRSEFDLDQTALEVLLIAAAPTLRGEIARLFGVLANDENRPVCDRYLIELILAGEHPEARREVADALADDAPLAHHGLIHIAPTHPDLYLFASVRVDPVLVRRLRGDRYADTGPDAVTTIRHADRSLEDLAAPRALLRDMVLALAQPARDGSAVRLVLRGRPGSGRRTLLAALAARVDKPLAVINAERLPRTPRGLTDGLRRQLRRAVLRGALPCVSGLEVIDSSDAEANEHVRLVLHAHPGPLAIRTSPERHLPLEPGFLSFTLPPLSETERLEFWNRTLERRGLRASGTEQLAARYRIGPGTIETVIDAVEARLEVDAEDLDDATEALDAAARQHIDTRMSGIATHVTRLPRWEQVALPDDIIDSLREFVGRIQHRRTVYDDWGFDRKMTTSRGLTALFYGPPGTGKSMVAGLIARELGLELYRIDLARVMSKWIGETEKNLAEVFDAGEDGQALILFDEADSLFSKRTEVKSSVDRYANLEVNYLLQRLDTFEGVAILTTNMEGSMDDAFKRRLSLRLSFPFPDEEMRVRLWNAHIPPELPTAGDFDFEDLAYRFPMSGGYIRNSCLRAAFLAAQEGVPLSQNHLVRAIHLEYREMGKLSSGGKLV